jgi:hypothetical protein
MVLRLNPSRVTVVLLPAVTYMIAAIVNITISLGRTCLSTVTLKFHVVVISVTADLRV